MPAAIAIPAIGAVSNIGGAAIQAHQAGKAAKTQQQAADRALQAQQQAYNDQLNLMRPFTQMGQSAASTLGGLLTPPPGTSFAGNAPMQAPPYPQPVGRQMPLGQVGPAPMGRMPQAPIGDGGGNAPMGLMRPAPMGRIPQAPLGQGGPSLGQAGQFVKMAAPDGSVRDVPIHMVQQLRQRGAQVIQ